MDDIQQAIVQALADAKAEAAPCKQPPQEEQPQDLVEMLTGHKKVCIATCCNPNPCSAPSVATTVIGCQLSLARVHTTHRSNDTTSTALQAYGVEGGHQLTYLTSVMLCSTAQPLIILFHPSSCRVAPPLWQYKPCPALAWVPALRHLACSSNARNMTLHERGSGNQ